MNQTRKIKGIMFTGSHHLARPWTTECVKNACRAYQTGWIRNYLCWRIVSYDKTKNIVYLGLTDSDSFQIIDKDLLNVLHKSFPVKPKKQSSL